MFEVLNDPARLHAMVVHFPIVVSVLGLPMLVLVLVGLWRRQPWLGAVRWMTMSAYGVGMVLGFVAHVVGESAMDALSVELSAEGMAALDRHEYMGELAYVVLAGVVILLAGTWLKKRKASMACGILAMVVGLLALGWVGLTAHVGGELVYEHLMVR